MEFYSQLLSSSNVALKMDCINVMQTLITATYCALISDPDLLEVLESFQVVEVGQGLKLSMAHEFQIRTPGDNSILSYL